MSNVSIVRRYFEEFFSGKARHSKVRDWLTDDFCFRDPLMSADSADDYVGQLVALGDELELRADLKRIAGDGDEVCALVDFQGPQGPITYSMWFTFRGDRIARLEVAYDPRSFLAPKGKASNPPPGYSRITPYLNYEDTGAMMEWLARAFGMVERQSMRRPDGSVTHAEMVLEDAVVMMGSPGGTFRNPKHLGQVTHSLYIYIDDLDNHCARAREAGAEIIEEPKDQPYGDRRYGAADPEGHHWYFASRLQQAPRR